jgi:hypothetical protein
MHKLVALSPIVSRPLTWEEICEQYPDQHVYLVEIESDEPLAPMFRSARVAGHGASLDEALDSASTAWNFYGKLEHYFTGRPRKPFTRPRVILDAEAADAIRYRW